MVAAPPRARALTAWIGVTLIFRSSSSNITCSLSKYLPEEADFNLDFLFLPAHACSTYYECFVERHYLAGHFRPAWQTGLLHQPALDLAGPADRADFTNGPRAREP